MDTHELSPMARIEILFELFDSAVSMMRQNLKRRHPDADDGEIEGLLRDWLQKREEAREVPSSFRSRSVP